MAMGDNKTLKKLEWVQVQFVRVSSSRNDFLKEYLKLKRNRVYRRKSQKIALEGPNLLYAALEAGLVPEAVFFTGSFLERTGESLIKALPDQTRKLVLTSKLFKLVADTESPQEVAAVVPFNPQEAGKPGRKDPDLVLVLDRIQDPGNMGSIVRTSLATGVDVIYYTAGSVDPYSPKAMRATAGAIFRQPMLQAPVPLSLVETLKQKGMHLVAATAGAGITFREPDYGKPTALIIGNEGGGISADLVEAAHLEVSIPLAGPVESLNAAVAAGVILYEIYQQRVDSLNKPH